MEDIDLKILHHIGRYTITLRRVLQVLFFNGGSAEGALKRLEKLGYIQRVERQLPGNFSYYQLKKKGAAVIGISENRAKPKELKGLAQDLAALWYCCMGDQPRRRLVDSELRALFGAPKGGNIVYVAQAEEDPSVSRLFIPEADTNLERYSPTLKREAHKSCNDEKLIRWIERGTYQFTVLLTDENRVAKLAELIRADEFPDLRIRVAIAPSPRDLSRFIPPDKESQISEDAAD
jgi:hypothetical protein